MSVTLYCYDPSVARSTERKLSYKGFERFGVGGKEVGGRERGAGSPLATAAQAEAQLPHPAPHLRCSSRKKSGRGRRIREEICRQGRAGRR